jgi:hypothetical protein
MSYRDDLDALRIRHDELAAELDQLRREQRRFEDASTRADALEHEVEALRERLETMQEQRRLPLLNDVRVASPCSESWDEMVGDERVRFCLKCEKSVYNVSAMGREEAETLIADSETKEGLCLRMYRRKDGRILTADCPVGQRRKRVTRIAAAAFAFGGVAAVAAIAAPVAVMGGMDVAVPTIEVPTPVEPVEEPEMGEYEADPRMGEMLMGDVMAPEEAARHGSTGSSTP